ncbi:MAG TPA: hydroxymethylglutaryl-CoA synthase [Yaniella sp.]
MKIGIHDLEVATSHYVLDLETLAERHDIDPNKFHIGLGQDTFSMPAPDEDIITMAAEAAQTLLERHDVSKIRQVLFATESSVDQSKAAGVYLHELLGLPANVRSVELKQACYSGTAALQMAVNAIARNPEEQILVITSDVARYALDSGGEPTQGAGSVAMLVSANPNLVEIEPDSGLHTSDVNDFWRPNDSTTPFVDGQLSLDAYLNATTAAWDDLTSRRDLALDDIHRFLHHQPFTKMARKQLAALAEHTGQELSDDLIEESMSYNRALGNTYTASLYFALTAQLHNNSELAGKRLGFFSYGSGAVAEFFTGVVQDNYRDHIYPQNVDKQLDNRVELTYDEYRELHENFAASSDTYTTPKTTNAPFRLSGVTEHQRRYEAQ